MGRIGITFDDVKQVAQSLLARGENPTVMRVREVLGTGSTTTINQHLQQFHLERRRNPSELPPDVPVGLMKAVEHFWQTAVTLAQTRLQAEREQIAAQVAALTAERDAAHDQQRQTAHELQREQALTAQFQLRLQERETLTADLQTRLQRADLANDALKQEMAALQQQAAAQQQQAQRDLDALRAQQQQTLADERARAEQEQQRLLLQTDQLRQEQRQALQQLQKEQQQLATALQQQIVDLQQQRQRLFDELHEKNQRLNELEAAAQSWEQQQRIAAQRELEIATTLVHWQQTAAQQTEEIAGLREQQTALQRENWQLTAELAVLQRLIEAWRPLSESPPAVQGDSDLQE